jgi:transcription elongation factor GreA
VSDDVVMTAKDAEKLEAELQRLQTSGRQEIAARIKTAREWGDLKENAEYHDAKNDQAKLETEILRLRDRRSRAEIREVVTATDVVGFGSCVEVIDRADGRAHTYVLVASTEARPAEGRLAYDSPIGRALNGSATGQVVSFTTPKGERTFEITAIRGG